MATTDEPENSEKKQASQETKTQIETLYQNSIDHIAQLKTRQWDVTKWVLAANVALFIPIAIKGTGNETYLPCELLYAIMLLSLTLGLLGVATMIKTQFSLRDMRQRQKAWRGEHPELAAADRIGRKKDEEKRRDSYFRDGWVWIPMLLISLASSAATIAAACAALP